MGLCTGCTKDFVCVHACIRAGAATKDSTNISDNLGEWGGFKYFEGEMGFTPHSLGEGVLCFRVSGTIFLNFP